MNWAFFRSPDTCYWILGNSEYLWYQRELEISVPETSIKLLNGGCWGTVAPLPKKKLQLEIKVGRGEMIGIIQFDETHNTQSYNMMRIASED